MASLSYDVCFLGSIFVLLEPLLNQLLCGIMTDRLLEFLPSVQTCNHYVLTVDWSSDWAWNSGFVSLSLWTELSTLCYFQCLMLQMRNWISACSIAGESLTILACWHFDFFSPPPPPNRLFFFFLRYWYQWLDLPWESLHFLILTHLTSDCLRRFLSLGGLVLQFALSGHPASVCSCFQVFGKFSCLSLSSFCNCQFYCGSHNGIKDPFWHCDPPVGWMRRQKLHHHLNQKLLNLFWRMQGSIFQPLLQGTVLLSNGNIAQHCWGIGKKLDEASSRELISSLCVRDGVSLCVISHCISTLHKLKMAGWFCCLDHHK